MLKNQYQHGTVSLGEYILTFALVVAVGAAMSVYIQRGLQARMHDARQYAMNNIREACNGTDCVGKGAVGEQYEPYYTQSSSEVSTNRVQQKGLLESGIGTSGIFISNVDINNQGNSTSNQLPPIEALRDKVLGGK